MFALLKGKGSLSFLQSVGKVKQNGIRKEMRRMNFNSNSFHPKYQSFQRDQPINPYSYSRPFSINHSLKEEEKRESLEKHNVKVEEKGEINVKKKGKRGKGLLVLLGLLVGVSYFALKESENPNDSKESGGEGSNPPSKEEKIQLYSEKMTTFIKRLPLGMVSYWWGKMTEVYVPLSLRGPIYGKFARMYHCNLDEMNSPLDSYQNFGEFFTRKLKDGVRKIDSAEIVSPADGRVLHYGEIEEDSIEQVKGISYSMNSFFGQNIHQLRREHHSNLSKQEKQKTKLYHCIIYLAPGDYHGFHSPTDWKITDRRYFPGHLFPVKPSFVSRLQGLFALNERIVLIGEWKHGFFSYTPVGATNVGSIKLPFDDIKTNQRPKLTEKHYDKNYSPIVNAQKGENLGFFHMGSTIILIFESPEYEFSVSQGQKIKLGEKLGNIKK